VEFLEVVDAVLLHERVDVTPPDEVGVGFVADLVDVVECHRDTTHTADKGVMCPR